ncbi:MAG TPA: hypothetical protein VK817_16810 [Trebonia sp.]|nr:hypothetical protein [Trebonia sp.]
MRIWPCHWEASAQWTFVQRHRVPRILRCRGFLESSLVTRLRSLTSIATETVCALCGTMPSGSICT